jgi:hypothetical protein
MAIISKFYFIGRKKSGFDNNGIFGHRKRKKVLLLDKEGNTFRLAKKEEACEM